MFQQPLPVEYLRLGPDETAARIGATRKTLGDRLIVLGHHYQRDEIIRWADFTGDSFKLSRLAAERTGVPFIVFCGVHFMAESADILTGDEQVVILPNLTAGCSMADMATIEQVEQAWSDIASVDGAGTVVPVTYVNSAATLKAFVGRHGGSCCTSSNARKVLEWALARGQKLFFFPDQHLGRNTAVAMGLDPDADMLLWDPNLPFGGVSQDDVRRARILLWRGHCSVHGRFTVEQVEQARREHPGIKVIVHPECTLDVVRAADMNGSTERIIEAVSQADAGSSWAVGTEINLVNRLQSRFPDRLVFCLDSVACPCQTMYRIHPRYLLWVLENLVQGTVVNQIVVPETVKADARVALERMLAIS